MLKASDLRGIAKEAPNKNSTKVWKILRGVMSTITDSAYKGHMSAVVEIPATGEALGRILTILETAGYWVLRVDDDPWVVGYPDFEISWG